MKFRVSLRHRVTLAFALLGVLVSLSLAGVLYMLTINMEERLIAETLSAELEDYMGRYELDPDTPPPASTTIRAYVSSTEKNALIPSQLVGLVPGLHQVVLDGMDYYVEVRKNPSGLFVVLYNADQIHHREEQFRIFLGISILIMTFVSAALGFWLAGRVVSPVRELARRVAGQRPEDHPPSLEKDFPRDEVGILARDIDAYLKRLEGFMDRERAFTTDVSHELRTPLAVIKGAVDVVLADTGLDKAQRTRMERIVRSVHEMSELTSALLMLAREAGDDSLEMLQCEVEEVLQAVVDRHHHELDHKPVTVEVKIQGHPKLLVEVTLLRVVLGNLIHNAFAYTKEGCVKVSLDCEGVTVADTGVGMSQEQLRRAFDCFYRGEEGSEGIGLSLVKRICWRYGWRVDVDSQEGRGTEIRLNFNDHGNCD